LRHLDRLDQLLLFQLVDMGNLDNFVRQHRVDHRIDGDGGLDLHLHRTDGAHFDHEQVLFGTGDEEIQSSLFQLFQGRVEEKLPLFAADAHPGDHFVHGDVGEVEGRRSGIECQRLKVRILIYAKQHNGDLNGIVEPFREKRAK